MISLRKSVFRVFAGTLTATIFTVLSMGLLLPYFAAEAQAKDKIGWVGPVYKELSASLNKGFKAYYKKTYGKEVDITFVRPGGWPVCLDKVRIWGGKPDADIFLGAGAPAHEIAKKEGLIVPYRPKNWDNVPAKWHGMKVKDEGYYWTCFAPWIVTNLYNEKVLKKLRLPPPKTWNDLLNPIYRGNIVHTLPYASGTMHETIEILMHRQHRYDQPREARRSSHRGRAAANERHGCAQRWLSRA
jgi:iron(III) transport system substrate-binding protein